MVYTYGGMYLLAKSRPDIPTPLMALVVLSYVHIVVCIVCFLVTYWYQVLFIVGVYGIHTYQVVYSRVRPICAVTLRESTKMLGSWLHFKLQYLRTYFYCTRRYRTWCWLGRGLVCNCWLNNFAFWGMQYRTMVLIDFLHLLCYGIRLLIIVCRVAAVFKPFISQQTILYQVSNTVPSAHIDQ